jgi:hypothetical protein
MPKSISTMSGHEQLVGVKCIVILEFLSTRLEHWVFMGGTREFAGEYVTHNTRARPMMSPARPKRCRAGRPVE